MKNSLFCFFSTIALLLSISCKKNNVYSKQKVLKRLEREGWEIHICDDMEYNLSIINGTFSIRGIDYHIDSIEQWIITTKQEEGKKSEWAGFITFAKKEDADAYYQCQYPDTIRLGLWYCAVDKKEYIDTNSSFVVSIVPLTFSGYSY